MSMYDSLYGREGRGIGPNEPEKKGFARFCQMVGRDLGQLLGTNLLVCLLCLTAALGVSLGVTLLSLPLTIVLGAATGLLAGLAGLLLAECCLRSLQNDPSQWLPRAKQSIASRWKTACVTGALGTLLLGLLCFVSAFLFEAAAQQGYYPGLAILVFLALDFLVLAVGFTLCMAAMQTLFPALRSEYGVEVHSIPRPAAPEQPLSAQEQKKRSRANWWYYHWGIVAVAAVVAVSVVYAAHGLMTAVDPDYTVAVVTAESLPDEAVQNLDESTPHIHERHVFDCENKYGEVAPQQEKALEALGFDLPDPDKPLSRRNNRKISFDAACRKMLFEIAKRHGLELEEEAEYGNRKYLEKQDFILAKQKEQLAAQQNRLDELTLKVNDMETLIDEVSAAAYDKAVEVVTDVVRTETRKEDMRMIEDTKKWVLSPERKAPQVTREYAAHRLDTPTARSSGRSKTASRFCRTTMSLPMPSA